MAGAAVAGLGAVAGAERQRAGPFKVYAAGYPGCSVAILPSSNRLALRAANPADRFQRWAKNAVSDSSGFELVNTGSGRTIMNAHILPIKLVESGHFHPRLLRATARWEEGGGGFAADLGDGGVDIFCVSVMRNEYLALKIAPWGHDLQGNIGIGAQAGEEAVAVVVEAENEDDGAASNEDHAGEAGAKAGEDDDAATGTPSTRNTRSRWCGRLRCLFPCPY